MHIKKPVNAHNILYHRNDKKLNINAAMPYWTLDILIELDPPYVTECNKLSIGMMEINLHS